MAGVRHKLLNFFRDNAIALASLSIAMMGLYLTITAQREERAHKELLLRPVLQLEADVGNYSVSLLNHGLGPALITDSLYYFDGRCHAVNNTNMEEVMQTDIIKVGRYFTNFFIEQFNAVKWKDGWKSSQVTRTTVPFPSQIVAVGQAFTIFKLESEFAMEVHSKLSDLGDETRQTVNDEFLRHSFSLPLLLRFCSMSEQYCAVGGGRFGKVIDIINRTKGSRNPDPFRKPEPFPEPLFRKWFAECK